MSGHVSLNRRFGFTLIELLVTTAVVGTLAAVVVPAMTKLAPSGDPARVASDLGSVKQAIELFSQHLRPLFPGDLEDLVNKISTSDNSVDGAVYRQADVDKWKGQYLQWTVDATDKDSTSVILFESAGGARIHSTLHRCPGALNWTGSVSPCLDNTEYPDLNPTNMWWVALKVTGIPASAGSEFKALNDVIDGSSESSPANTGLLRQDATGAVFFFLVPYLP